MPRQDAATHRERIMVACREPHGLVLDGCPRFMKLADGGLGGSDQSGLTIPTAPALAQRGGNYKTRRDRQTGVSEWVLKRS
eukprot:COSAG06_NODE_17245_length_953_cov_0.987119_1_plen_80_part_10